MIPIAGQPVLTVAAMREAEQRAIAAGATVASLMQAAGKGLAAAVARLGAGSPVLIVCGPGNNGSDGYVAATALRAAGLAVTVAAYGEPRTEAARHAAGSWGQAAVPLLAVERAPVLLDCLFGTGARPGLPPDVDAAMRKLASAARIVIAADLPSGTDADSGDIPGWLVGRPATVTLALGALKPAHVLEPAARACGSIRVIDLGLVDRPEAIAVAGHPALPQPDATSHKYSRGMVAVVAGDMAGAARLAGIAALRSGAGYVALYGDAGKGGPAALVHRPYDVGQLADPRIGAILIGPGLGRDDVARERVRALLAADAHPLVVDGDALHLVTAEQIAAPSQPVVLTPHAGEFRALFGTLPGSPIDQARAAAAQAGAVVVLKGPTTIVADATRAIVHPGGNPWLSTAGTGDVLAGAIAAQLAHPGAAPLNAASAGVWLHARASARLGASFIADDLANALTPVRASA